jgi:diaminopimelate decarboxylase
MLKLLQEYPIDFNKALGLNTLCIDNENVRRRVLKSKNIEIKGISFHVGSGGNDGKVYYKSISVAKALNLNLQEQKHQAKMVKKLKKH